MALQPITWKNIEAPDFRRVADIQSVANQRIDKSFEGVNKILGSLAGHKEGVQARNTADFQSRALDMFQTPEDLERAKQSGELDALQQRYAANGGLDRNQVSQANIDNLFSAGHTQNFNQSVDRAITDENLGQFDTLLNSQSAEGQYGTLKKRFDDARLGKYSDDQINRGIGEDIEKSKTMRDEMLMQQEFIKKTGVNLHDLDLIKDPEKHRLAEEFLAGRRERVTADPDAIDYLRNLEQELIDQGIEPGLARAQADKNFMAIINGRSNPASIMALKKQDYQRIRDLSSPNNPLTNHLFDPQPIKSIDDLMQGSDRKFSDLTPGMKRSIEEVTGFAMNGEIPANTFGNSAPIPLPPEIAKSAVKHITSEDSTLKDFIWLGTTNALENLDHWVTRGVISSKYLDEYADAMKRKTEVDKKYSQQLTPGGRLSFDPGVESLRSANRDLVNDQLAADPENSEVETFEQGKTRIAGLGADKLKELAQSTDPKISQTAQALIGAQEERVIQNVSRREGAGLPTTKGGYSTKQEQAMTDLALLTEGRPNAGPTSVAPVPVPVAPVVPAPAPAPNTEEAVEEVTQNISPRQGIGVPTRTKQAPGAEETVEKVTQNSSRRQGDGLPTRTVQALQKIAGADTVSPGARKSLNKQRDKAMSNLASLSLPDVEKALMVGTAMSPSTSFNNADLQSGSPKAENFLQQFNSAGHMESIQALRQQIADAKLRGNAAKVKELQAQEKQLYSDILDTYSQL